ncbi:hypothetical protein [Haloarcula salinisoli]|uniref:Uncharacterized protein n=1 Tax=Haloarcula salinisoli TaxID=2487746 RepID=A0A8J8CB09_9EURY|nr:hypothetical protein [Halomicroarcula salinisoli]MBX0288451.1 hypothetical protein [Halomicroarcula salinisoli]MBX0305729.1 hypothetical protein [Halomicroarcula salinisoli]
MDGTDIVAYEDVNELPEDAADRIKQILDKHPLEQYPEGAYIGSLAPPGFESRHIREPETIISEPYPYGIELLEFPPEEDKLYNW